jgi:type III secretion protein Q
MNARTANLPAGSPVRRLMIRYEPPIKLARTQISALNAAATRRRAFTAELAGQRLAITVIGLERTAPDSAAFCHFGLGRDQTRPILSVPKSLAESLIGCIQDGLGLPEEPLRSLLVELALAGLLDALDTRITVPSRLEPAEAPLGDFDRLILDIQWGGWQGRAYLHLPRGCDSALIAAIADLLKLLPEAHSAMNELLLPLAFEVGASRLPVGLLSGLRPGDIALLQTYYPASGEILVALGRTATKAALAGRTATLHAPFGTHPALAMEISMNQVDGGKASPIGTNAALDHIEVTLTFELGRRTIDLRALRTMAPGHVFDLGRDPEGPVDIIANGKTIGAGEIVRIGETIGVRVTRLFLHD